jgi:predicted small lipoprotein YifL
MKNIITVALMATTVLSLAACGGGDKAKKPIDTTSTTVIDSSTKTTTVIDSTKHDTVKVAEQKNPAKRSGSGDALGSASMRAMKDSIRKDSAKLSRK